jgi:hypothetical protein
MDGDVMRKFQVGDKVRWYEIDGRPLWNFDTIEEVCADSGRGRWIEGIVTSVTDAAFDVSSVWRWPQPDHSRALYGEPGYLELVEAVPEPRFVVREDDLCHLYVADLELSLLASSSFPESCRPELEALCSKLNKGEK